MRKTSLKSKLFLGFGTFLFLGIVFSVLPKAAQASPNNQGLGWAMPIAKSANNATCVIDPDYSAYSYVLVVLVDKTNPSGGMLTGNIRLKGIAYDNTVSASSASFAGIGCIVPSTGLFISVSGVRGYNNWSTSTTAPSGATGNFNWCCGMKVDYAGLGGNGGHSLVYYVYLTPTGNSPAMETVAPADNATINATIARPTTANVDVSIKSVSGLDSASTQMLDGFIYIQGQSNQAIPACGGASDCFVSYPCFPCGGIGTTRSMTLSNLPLGDYIWYGQLHESARRSVVNWLGTDYTLPNDIPITAQSDFQHFTIAAPSTTNTLYVKSTGASGVVITGTTWGGRTDYSKTSTSDMNDTLHAPTVSGYNFNNWSGDCVSYVAASRDCTISVTGNGTKTVTANYTKIIVPNAADLRVKVFEDRNGDGIQNGTDPNVSLAEAPDIEIRKNSTTGPFMPLNGATIFHSYEEDVTAGNYQIFMTPGTSGRTPTKYNFFERFKAATVYNYVAAAAPFVRTNSHFLGANLIWYINMGVSPAPAAAPPDLVITKLSADPAAPNTGDLVNFTGEAKNIGTSSTGVSVQARFCIDAPTPLNCYTTTTSRIGGLDQAVEILAPGATSASISSLSWTATTVGPHRVTLCVDVVPVPPPGAVTEVRDDVFSNCRAINFNVGAADQSWVKTENGNVGTGGNINLGSYQGSHNASYIIQLAGSITPIFTSAKNWVIQGAAYPPVPQDPNTYAELYEKLSGSSACSLTTATNIPNAQGRFRVGDLTVNGGNSGACGTPQTGKDAAVIFVEGDLTISDNPLHLITYGQTRPTVFIVSGDINIDQNVDQVDAVLISNKSISTGSAAFNNLLTVKGSIIGALEDSGSLVRLNRKTGDLSEHIILQPSYFYYLTDYAGIASTHYKEENP